MVEETVEDLEAEVGHRFASRRLDAVAAELFEDFSRTRLQKWINEGFLLVDGCRRRAKDRLVGGERLVLQLSPDAAAECLDDLEPDSGRVRPEPVSFDVVFEDEHILVINKPAGLVMHPAPGNRNGTLLNGLLHRDPSLLSIPRAGIVHRLDKDTTGLCVVAKTLSAHTHLVRQLQARTMGRQYLAVATGVLPHSDTIDAPIGRHPKDRKRMAVVANGKPAVTHYERLEQYACAAQTRVRLETGRTHQIRVHMAHLGFGLVGDPVYGKKLRSDKAGSEAQALIAQFPRQALHACQLSLVHPYTQKTVDFHAPMPTDLDTLCASLKTLS